MAYEYENYYKIGSEQSVRGLKYKKPKRVKGVVDGVNSDKGDIFRLIVDELGISYEEMGAVIGKSGRWISWYIWDRGINDTIRDIVYILTGEDISYMMREGV